MKKLMSILFVGWILASGSLAQAATPAEEAFAKLKTMAGTWKSSTNAGENTISYTVRADGSALEEVVMGMVTMFHLDGNSLLLTHYCTLGNQPRLRATVFPSPVSSLEFVFQDITNLKPGVGHISGAKFEFVDENHVNETWQYTKPDGTTGTEFFKHERISKAGGKE